MKARALACVVACAAACTIYGEDETAAPAPPSADAITDASAPADATTTDASSPDPEEDGGLDAEPIGIDAGIDAAPPRDLLVFVTSATFPGDFGKGPVPLSAGDRICNDLAVPRPKLRGKVFVAWLGTTVEPDQRLVRAAGHRYVDLQGTVITTTPATMGTLEHAITLDELGTSFPIGSEVWTGTGAVACDGWSTTSPAKTAAVGIAGERTSAWTFASYGTCDKLRRLYCFEVP